MNTIDGNSVNSLEFRRICAQHLSDCQQKPIHDITIHIEYLLVLYSKTGGYV